MICKLKINKLKSIFSLLIILIMISGVITANGSIQGPWQRTYTVDTVNGHPGYTTEWRGYDALDKPVIIVLGYDPSDDDTAQDAANDYVTLIEDMNSRGFDIIIFDYLDGDADLKINADNLARFLEYLDEQMSAEGFVDNDGDGHPDYELSIVGGSMGGIVTRTMFVQEMENMGVDIFATLDSPHYGVYLSASIDWIAAGLDNTAGQQMLHGSDLYNEHYGWLQGVEGDTQFMQQVIDPIDTAAIALSNGESRWKVSWYDDLVHTKYHPVSSYISTIFGDSDFIPYHSAVYLDSTSTLSSLRWGYTYYNYADTSTSYFDAKIQNPRDEHKGQLYAIQQAMDFVEANWG